MLMKLLHHAYIPGALTKSRGASFVLQQALTHTHTRRHNSLLQRQRKEAKKSLSSAYQEGLTESRKALFGCSLEGGEEGRSCQVSWYVGHWRLLSGWLGTEGFV